MLFVKRRRILVTCSRRLENPAGLRLSPSFFLVSEILVMQMSGGGPANPYIRVGEPAALQPGGQGRPPRCRAAGPQGTMRKYFRKSFCTKTPAASQGPARKYFRKSCCTKADAAPQRGDQVPAARQRGYRGIFL